MILNHIHIHSKVIMSERYFVTRGFGFSVVYGGGRWSSQLDLSRQLAIRVQYPRNSHLQPHLDYRLKHIAFSSGPRSSDWWSAVGLHFRRRCGAELLRWRRQRRFQSLQIWPPPLVVLLYSFVALAFDGPSLVLLRTSWFSIGDSSFSFFMRTALAAIFFVGGSFFLLAAVLDSWFFATCRSRVFGFAFRTMTMCEIISVRSW